MQPFEYLSVRHWSKETNGTRTKVSKTRIIQDQGRPPRPQLWEPCADRTRFPCCCRSAKSVIDSETGLKKRGLWAFAEVFTKLSKERVKKTRATLQRP